MLRWNYGWTQDPAFYPQIVKFEWSTVGTGTGRPYMLDSTAQKFLEENTLGPPVSYKRPRVDLAGHSFVSPEKAGRKPGWRKPRLVDDA